jgi:hypothetical protein
VNWTIGRRITVGYGVAVILLLALALLAIWALTRASDGFGDALALERDQLTVALRAQNDVRGANVMYLRYLVDGNDRWATGYDSLIVSARGRLTRLRDGHRNADASATWAEAVQLVERWHEAATASMAAGRAGDIEEATRLRLAVVQPVRQSVDEVTDRGVEMVQRTADSAIDSARDVADTSRIVLLIGAALAIIGGVIAARLLDAAVRGPLQETSSVLASSATEILAATTQQATGAQESLAAVTQTAATADQVTQTAEQAAERARSVAGTAQRAAEIGGRGREAIEESTDAIQQVREQVESVVASIRELAGRAQAIGEINATVTDLSEQTNLLALNAAIEAARAGEQGRGFAVVAGEIKTLADQSKGATARVRQLLGEVQSATQDAVRAADEGQRRAAHGERQVNQAGETIRSLAEAASAAAQAAAQISASAGQQSTGMTQIRQAIGNIQQAAQQNLAATKQAEAASRDLSRLGSRLLDLVGDGSSSPRVE